MRIGFVLKSAAVAGVLTLVAVVSAGDGDLVQAGGGGCHQAPKLEGTGNEVALRRYCFVPLVLTVDPGTHVTFKNEDGVDHVVWGGPSMAPGEASLAPGASATRTFVEPGIYPYYCNLHYAMTGIVVVGDGKFAKHPGSDGFATGGSSDALGVQAVQPRPAGAGGTLEPPPLAATTTTDEDQETWPLILGGVIGVAGLTAGASLSAVGLRRRS